MPETEREDSGRQARPAVFLDETEHPQTLHEVAQIMLSCQDRPLDSDEISDERLHSVRLSIVSAAPDELIGDLTALGYSPTNIEITPTS